ncbi:unnamed protein product [Microthlaspi erraticum]|uniref:Subtilisin-like protease fibronectin type-III domain-containing protein n=1 Tax=Microthlaspi erraticum TaxID=1685480 RepID=A0A6D2L067_9BRAS|nr:unnamed protein product [Microthlaspi erraticum]
MGIVKGSPKACVFIGILFILNCAFCCVLAQENGNEETKKYVVYLGATKHDDPEVVTESHYRMLESVFESPEAARKSMVYTYRHSFSGFAAWLTRSQAKNISDRPDVFSMGQESKLEMQSTRMYEFLEMTPNTPKGILQESNMGSGLIIGVLDTGIWPESEAFNDEGYGPIPKHWKGECVAGAGFDPKIHCNKKLIGAKYYLDSWFQKNAPAVLAPDEFLSPRGYGPHGTMCAAISASSFVPNVSYNGLGLGVMRGAAPKARIAMYKVMWNEEPFGMGSANLVRAIDEAVKDGVDVLTISIGATPAPIKPVYALGEDMEVGTFHAVMKGIPVAVGGGNSGPDAYTVTNTAPWLISVAASTLDRAYHVDITLGNNMTIVGIARNREAVSADIVYVEDWKKLSPTGANPSLEGKIVLTFVSQDFDVAGALNTITLSPGVIGVIVARSTDTMSDFPYFVPDVTVDFEAGTKILRYMSTTSSPRAHITRARTVLGHPLTTAIPKFSSRGPNPSAPAILKPDIVAPGMNIIAHGSGYYVGDSPKVMIGQGTSFATPAIAGIVTLLKALHPDWSPAMLKSAIMTSARTVDPSGDPIFAEGYPRKLADPFDMGAGLVNPEKARDPGLVYDMNLDDYVHFFCASDYPEEKITLLTGKETKCPSPRPSLLDVNYPAITIPYLAGEVTVTRTVTNVGPVDSVYRPVIEAPEGVKVAVEPETLVFNSSTKKLAFKVKVTTTYKSNTGYYFGSFAWTDGTRNVNIPLSVRTRVTKFSQP